MGKVRIKAKTKAKVKNKPIKAGSTNRGGSGGIFTTKVILINKNKAHG